MGGRQDIATPMSIVVGFLAVLGFVKLRTLHERGTPLWMLVVLVVFVLVALAAAAWALWKIWPSDDADRKMRDTGQLTEMIGQDAARKGVRLRASIDSHKGVDMRELGAVIGRIGRKAIIKSWEDFTIIFMGPRSNKTSAVAVPRILSAPGAVVATSNKPDLWILTGGLRERVGPIYAFDPGNIAYAPQTWWWNILGHVSAFKDARRIATHFVSASSDGASRANDDPFFTPTGKNLLAFTMLAAALDGLSMRDVLRWIDTYSGDPVEILGEKGKRRESNALAALLELPNDTRGGVFGQAATALASIQDEDTLKWVTPPETWEEPPKGAAPIEELDLWSLFAFEPGAPPTLYLMSQEGSESAGPVVAAIVDRIFQLGDLAASAYGGRVDPPLTVVLDECANICRIDALPDLASHLGSKSICVDAIFQSEDQAISVWGRDRYGALWGAATVRIAGAGLQDPAFAKKLSDLIGTHKVREVNSSRGPGGYSSSDHLVREQIMPPEDIAAMKKKHALLIRQESRPVLIDLIPWYNEPESGDIDKVKEIATKQVQQSAIAYLGASNPVAKALSAQMKSDEP